MQTTPTKQQIEHVVHAALDAVAASSDTRSRFKRRRTPIRTRQLERSLDACVAAAEPLRSFIGMVAWHDFDMDTELMMKDAIAKLRYERRQIAKML